ncbi:hypothetical protein K3977_04625 [Weissella viridescens]|uniref:hypothetical protein n=1 Tax=Weissella viridescens TaxID=1629 RepID=UPI001C7D42C0|nr:hypothetical protein [Weissella viridescens]MBX4172894.1 hypothetical protein [Weissella viridescens]
MQDTLVKNLRDDLVGRSLDLFGWFNVKTIAFSGVDNMSMDIDEMVPTMVPSFLVDQETVRCVLIQADVNVTKALLSPSVRLHTEIDYVSLCLT